MFDAYRLKDATGHEAAMTIVRPDRVSLVFEVDGEWNWDGVLRCRSLREACLTALDVIPWSDWSAEARSLFAFWAPGLPSAA